MKKLFLVTILLAFTAVLWSDDLAEIARKEKARREALEKEGKKARVLTNKDVPTIKSSLGIESASPVAEEPTTEPQSESAAAAIDEAATNSQEELERLKQEKADLTRDIQSTSDSIEESGVQSKNIGEQFKEKRLKEEQLKKVEDQIEQLEKSTKEEKTQQESESESPEN
jgi:predicted RNase H-like nuclease (RuvC/YqgF family)